MQSFIKSSRLTQRAMAYQIAMMSKQSPLQYTLARNFSHVPRYHFDDKDYEPSVTQVCTLNDFLTNIFFFIHSFPPPPTDQTPKNLSTLCQSLQLMETQPGAQVSKKWVLVIQFNIFSLIGGTRTRQQFANGVDLDT